MSQLLSISQSTSSFELFAESDPLPTPQCNVEFTPPDLAAAQNNALRHLVIAFIIASIATAVFFVCPLAAFALWGFCGWFLWSAAIVTLNYLAANSCIAKPIHRLNALTFDINCMFYTLPLLPLTFFKRCHEPEQVELEGIPILMLNGYLGYGTTWKFQKEALEERGLGPVHTMNVETGKEIKSNAEKVARKVNNICAQHQCNEIILIGHSKGGLVATYYATALAANQTPPIRVTKVITIASPLEGTPIAHMGLTPDARDMHPSSAFIQTLGDLLEDNPDHTQFYRIGSESDTVVPITSAMGNGKHPQFKVRDMGHLGLIFDPRVAEQMSQWIQGPTQDDGL